MLSKNMFGWNYSLLLKDMKVRWFLRIVKNIL
jgi:hypothetical protein